MQGDPAACGAGSGVTAFGLELGTAGGAGNGWAWCARRGPSRSLPARRGAVAALAQVSGAPPFAVEKQHHGDPAALAAIHGQRERADLARLVAVRAVDHGPEPSVADLGVGDRPRPLVAERRDNRLPEADGFAVE